MAVSVLMLCLSMRSFQVICSAIHFRNDGKEIRRLSALVTVRHFPARNRFRWIIIAGQELYDAFRIRLGKRVFSAMLLFGTQCENFSLKPFILPKCVVKPGKLPQRPHS